MISARSTPQDAVRARRNLGRGVHVRWLPVAEAPPVSELVADLSDRERLRLAAVADPAAARRFALGRAALRSLAREVAGIERVTVRARCASCGGDHGRPVLGGSGRLDRSSASIGHSGSAVVVAVSTEGPIGVDLEDAHGADERLRAIETLAPGEADPLRRWTRIEAVLKADGRGLDVDPSTVGFRRTGAAVSAVIGEEETRYRVADLPLHPSLVVSLATIEQRPPGASSIPIGWRRLRLAELTG